MAGNSLTIEQIMDLLTNNPLHIAKLTADLTLAQLHTTPDLDEWSANDVLAHLRSCADMWVNAIEAILEQDNRTIKAINPRTWIDSTDYPNQKFRTSFRAFHEQRNELLATLKALPQKSWSSSATVTGAGKPLERTVYFYAHWLATHERTHVKQIGRIVNTIRK